MKAVVLHVCEVCGILFYSFVEKMVHKISIEHIKNNSKYKHNKNVNSQKQLYFWPPK